MPRGGPRSRRGVLVKSAELIGWALGGLEREIAETRERLASLTAQAAKLRAQAGRRGRGAAASAALEAAAPPRRGRRRRKMSAEARKRLSEATRKRWAERKKKGMTKL